MKFTTADHVFPETYKFIVSNERDDIVVNAPKIPMKRKALIIGSKSTEKNISVMREHPTKLTSNVFQAIPSDAGRTNATENLRTAPTAPPAAINNINIKFSFIFTPGVSSSFKSMDTEND